MQFDEYKATIQKQLHESELQNFTEPVVDGFKMRMMQSCRCLIEAGHHAWSKKDHYYVQFLTHDTPLEMASLNDSLELCVGGQTPHVGSAHKQGRAASLGEGPLRCRRPLASIARACRH